MQHCWVFKEVGIETLLDKLLIDGDISGEGDVAAKDEEELLAALGETGLEEKEETQQVGQIIVKIKRVTVTQAYDTLDFKPVFSEGQKDDVNMTGMDGITHTSQWVVLYKAELPIHELTIEQSAT